MAITETTILTTRESILEPQRLGQVISVPDGRLDKVSVYLEKVSDGSAVSATVIAEVYAVTISGIPTGSSLAIDTADFSDINGSNFVNFRLECNCPLKVAIIIRMSGGDSKNFVGWRYSVLSSGLYPSLISTDNGASWTADSSKKFAFIAYSFVENTVDSYDQSATLRAGTTDTIEDDTQTEWNAGVLNRLTALPDNTVKLTLGNMNISFVLDQSGSMSWNDPNGLRMTFIEDLVADIEATIPPGIATYSLFKICAEPIENMVAYDSRPMEYSTRIIRKTNSAPTNPSDGSLIFSGYSNKAFDKSLSYPATYHYAAYHLDSAGQYSDPVYDVLVTNLLYAQPVGVANFEAELEIVLTLGEDLGKRNVNLSWQNPSGFDYSSVTIVRRDDRYPMNLSDGTVVASLPSATVSYTDNYGGSQDFVGGLIYYYSIFTVNVNSIKCSYDNARKQTVLTTPADRSWELNDPPTPPAGFSTTPPAAPVVDPVISGRKAVELSWTGDATSVRYKIYFDGYKNPSLLADGTYTGTLVYDGSSTTFRHYGLENAEPHYYAIVALDMLVNQSVATYAFARPTEDSITPITPRSPSEFHVDLVSIDKSLASFVNESYDNEEIVGYFDEKEKINSIVLSRDQYYEPTNTFLEFTSLDSNGVDTRTVVPVSGQTVAASDAIRLESYAKFEDLGSVSSISASSLKSVKNNMLECSLRATPLFYSENESGRTIEIRGKGIDVTLERPFSLVIKNEPVQVVSRRTWNGVQTAADGTKTKVGYVNSTFTGTYVYSNKPFYVTLEATFNGQNLGEETIQAFFSIIDPNTNEVSKKLVMPDSNSSSILVTTLTTVTDEILDRNGEPSGEYQERTIYKLEIPPQTSPGEYILNATATFNNQTSTAQLRMSFEPILNIDMTTAGFIPDGESTQEQFAYVYLGAFDGVSKTSVANLSIVDWSIQNVAGAPVDNQVRPFYSTDNVIGTGIKSYVSNGTASKVFFGPGLDVDPSTGASAHVTAGELYEIKAVVQYQEMTGIGYGFIELLPLPESDTLERIFLRNTTRFNYDEIPADGQVESTWEVIAHPSDDVGGIYSGKYFNDKLTSLGGTVGPLNDGDIVDLTAEPFYGSGNQLIIKTDLYPEGRSGSARATVSGGKAIFRVSLNQSIYGADKRYDKGDARNIIYGASVLQVPQTPLIYKLRAMISVESGGNVIVYRGGGGDMSSSTPPCLLGFYDPLGA
jgi:hypothetical protein